MAVVDTYTNGNANTNKSVYNSSIVNGSQDISMVAVYTPAAGDSNGSTYRFFKDVPSNLIPISLTLMTSSAVSSGACNVGIYKPNNGAVISANCLASALATTAASRVLDATSAVAISDQQKTLAELAGIDCSKYPVVDIVVTATVAFGAQALALKGSFQQK